MRFELSTAPTEEPVTIGDIESHSVLGTIPADQVTELSGSITAARELCQSRLSRQFCTATWKAYLDYFPDEIQICDKLPISSITSIQYIDTDAATQTLSSSLYDADFASPNKPCRIEPAYGQTWPLTRSVQNAVTITFVAGYGARAAVPQVVKNAMLTLIAHWYENREIVAPVTLHNVPMGFEALLSAADWGAYA